MHTPQKIEDIRIVADSIGEAGLEKDISIPEILFSATLDNPDITVTKPLTIHYVVTRTDDIVRAEIELKGHITTQCVVCLAPVDYPISLTFVTDYLPATPDMPQDLEAERQSPSVGYYRKEIPLGEYILSELVLSLPVRYVCRENCRGLCSHCGANLNEGACACSGGHDLRFDKLTAIKNKLRKE